MKKFHSTIPSSASSEAKRAGACGKELKRRRLFGEHHFLNVDARLNQM
jgi:hypothetical protein